MKLTTYLAQETNLNWSDKKVKEFLGFSNDPPSQEIFSLWLTFGEACFEPGRVIAARMGIADDYGNHVQMISKLIKNILPYRQLSKEFIFEFQGKSLEEQKDLLEKTTVRLLPMPKSLQVLSKKFAEVFNVNPAMQRELLERSGITDPAKTCCTSSCSTCCKDLPSRQFRKTTFAFFEEVSKRIQQIVDEKNIDESDMAEVWLAQLNQDLSAVNLQSALTVRLFRETISDAAHHIQIPSSDKLGIPANSSVGFIVQQRQMLSAQISQMYQHSQSSSDGRKYFAQDHAWKLITGVVFIAWAAAYIYKQIIYDEDTYSTDSAGSQALAVLFPAFSILLALSGVLSFREWCRNRAEKKGSTPLSRYHFQVWG